MWYPTTSRTTYGYILPPIPVYARLVLFVSTPYPMSYDPLKLRLTAWHSNTSISPYTHPNWPHSVGFTYPSYILSNDSRNTTRIHRTAEINSHIRFFRKSECGIWISSPHCQHCIAAIRALQDFPYVEICTAPLRARFWVHFNRIPFNFDARKSTFSSRNAPLRRPTSFIPITWLSTQIALLCPRMGGEFRVTFRNSHQIATSPESVFIAWQARRSLPLYGAICWYALESAHTSSWRNKCISIVKKCAFANSLPYSLPSHTLSGLFPMSCCSCLDARHCRQPRHCSRMWFWCKGNAGTASKVHKKKLGSNI